jgi:hypothetical protein
MPKKNKANRRKRKPKDVESKQPTALPAPDRPKTPLEHRRYLQSIAAVIIGQAHEQSSARLLGAQQGRPRGAWVLILDTAEEGERVCKGLTPALYKFIESSTGLFDTLKTVWHPGTTELLGTYDMAKRVFCLVMVRDPYTDGTIVTVPAVGYFPPSMTATGSFLVGAVSGNRLLCSLPSCGKTGGLKCGTCRSSIYCSTACQTSDWDRHRLRCMSASARKKIVDEARVEASGLTILDTDDSGNQTFYDFTRKDVSDDID